MKQSGRNILGHDFEGGIVFDTVCVMPLPLRTIEPTRNYTPSNDEYCRLVAIIVSNKIRGVSRDAIRKGIRADLEVSKTLEAFGGDRFLDRILNVEPDSRDRALMHSVKTLLLPLKSGSSEVFRAAVNYESYGAFLEFAPESARNPLLLKQDQFIPLGDMAREVLTALRDPNPNRIPPRAAATIFCGSIALHAPAKTRRVTEWAKKRLKESRITSPDHSDVLLRQINSRKATMIADVFRAINAHDDPRLPKAADPDLIACASWQKIVNAYRATDGDSLSTGRREFVAPTLDDVKIVERFMTEHGYPNRSERSKILRSNLNEMAGLAPALESSL